ncbi:MAG: DUF1254 domain-containing protein [Actinomycetota bacterium]
MTRIVIDLPDERGTMSAFAFDRNAGPMPNSAPAPETLETSFGTIEFAGGAYPTPESARLLFDELGFQPATQAYINFYPALSLLGLLAGQSRDVGAMSCSEFGVYADFATATDLYLTADTDSVYATLTFDLGEDGPTVVETPEGMYGPADDAYFRSIVEMSSPVIRLTQV